ncbi:uncharacterized protein FIBRA_06503 [Fibroporia radiculosa]|uniref:BTB domain-containing protein n=1 Tax=Fibroporia radiculosa TaxID=599839 RepID=J4HZ78_9APHY|nr:uncharacterized protein FIBRA_06503 [Fibroporia radiculosa]CCM04332.1 predicted protein [Fibroporia radiculosa]
MAEIVGSLALTPFIVSPGVLRTRARQPPLASEHPLCSAMAFKPDETASSASHALAPAQKLELTPPPSSEGRTMVEPPPAESGPLRGAGPVRVRSKFYMSDGSVFLSVLTATPVHEQLTLYRVHRYFLERDSDFFRSLLVLPPGDAERGPDGATEETAIPLLGVTTHEMECLLFFLYHGMYERKVWRDDWVALLSISSRFLFEGIRKRAVQEITRFTEPLDPVERVVLATRHDVPQWLKPAYVELCQRRDALSVKEGQQIGLETAIPLARAREELLRRRIVCEKAAEDIKKHTPCKRKVEDCQCCRRVHSLLGTTEDSKAEAEKIVQQTMFPL